MLRYAFEYDDSERIRAGFIGCGEHSFRNIYPALRYAPVRLAAVCDLDESRARAYAKEFGAERAYRDYEAMLAREFLDAVFVVTSYDENALPRFPRLAIAVMESGAHAWIEKPPAASTEEVRAMMRVSEQTGKFVQVGFKKMFFPAIEKLHAISRGASFGRLTSLSVRYPQSLPPVEKRHDNRAMLGFLDHICHPGSILHYLGGAVKTLFYERAPNGATVASLCFVSGAVGSLHLAAGQSGTSPLERVEVVGEGENAVVDNGVRLTWYRRGRRGAGGYGRSSSFIGDDASAPLFWEPEFSLGQLYNKGLFLIGYAPELLYFVECVRANRPPEKAHLADALEITKLYEAFRFHPPGTVIPLNA